MKKVSIVIPCYNEATAIPLLYAALLPVMAAQSEYQWEVLFINDGSKDETLAVIKALRAADARVNYVDLSRNFGKERAMLAGFDYVAGDCMVLMDADLQHPPQVIPEMLSWWEQGYDDVYGKRISRGREHWLRKRLSLAFYKILQKSARMEILQNVGDFRLLDRCCINTLKKLREQERYTKGMFTWIGFRKHEVLFETQNRAAYLYR
jgi:glycosyltransferase involved in cell wall biosynthesis